MKESILVSPHKSASKAGAQILQEGGNAVEAAIAIAATLCAVYPHMTGLGGDGFWLIAKHNAGENGQRNTQCNTQENIQESTQQNTQLFDPTSLTSTCSKSFKVNGFTPSFSDSSSQNMPFASPIEHPIFIDACGRSGENVEYGMLQKKGFSKLPTRGVWSALTMAGAVSGWEQALTTASTWQLQEHSPKSLEQLFSSAIAYAKNGAPVCASFNTMLTTHKNILEQQPNFAEHFLPAGKVPQKGSLFTLPKLATTLQTLAKEGLHCFYTGTLAHTMAKDLASLGSPLTRNDFANHTATCAKALQMHTYKGTFYNSPPPTQGVASLLILGQVLALCEEDPKLAQSLAQNEQELIHLIVEATKTAFSLRSQYIADPEHMAQDVKKWLKPTFVQNLAKNIKKNVAAPWPIPSQTGGDTVWFGVIDKWGNAVSSIQSIYHEFGSGVVLPSTGLLWHNRALGFTFDKKHPNVIAPLKKPFHTLNPALAVLNNGELLSYGTMGGEGQPQTQAAVILRYLFMHLNPEEALTAPRWLLGRSWGDISNNLKIEQNMPQPIVDSLFAKGHTLKMIAEQSDLMGHAGLLVRSKQSAISGGYDPRSDGSVEKINE